jgi:hypothetical protein
VLAICALVLVLVATRLAIKAPVRAWDGVVGTKATSGTRRGFEFLVRLVASSADFAAGLSSNIVVLATRALDTVFTGRETAHGTCIAFDGTRCRPFAVFAGHAAGGTKRNGVLAADTVGTGLGTTGVLTRLAHIALLSVEADTALSLAAGNA